MTLEGFQERTRRLLLGDDETPGIVAELRSNDQELNDEEIILLSNLPAGSGGLLIRLTSIREDAGRTFVETLMPHLTTEWARIVSDDLIEAVASSIVLVDSEHVPAVHRLVDQARNRLNQEVRRRQDAHGSPLKPAPSHGWTISATIQEPGACTKVRPTCACRPSTSLEAISDKAWATPGPCKHRPR